METWGQILDEISGQVYPLRRILILRPVPWCNREGNWFLIHKMLGGLFCTPALGRSCVGEWWAVGLEKCVWRYGVAVV